MAAHDAEAVVLGGGVVGCAVAHALALRGVSTLLLEAEAALATAASGTNSGIVHTGFDSKPGELETAMILRAAELRGALIDELGAEVRACGARLRPTGHEQQRAVAELAANARRNGVEASLTAEGELLVPGEAITDPVRFTRLLAAAAVRAGAAVRLDSPASALERAPDGGVRVQLEGGSSVQAKGVANCAGLHADELAATAGDERFEVYPRKGEFLVFEQPAEPLREILLPVPSSAGKGVLVFPTLDGHLIAGPTARERTDKRDWSVEADAGELILAKARAAFPPLDGAEPIAAYAGLRPAGRGCNYVIAASAGLPGLVNAAAIRSTGLTAAPAIAEHVAALLSRAAGLALHAPAQRVPLGRSEPGVPWWRTAAERSGAERR